jgi:hypothetical protein
VFVRECLVVSLLSIIGSGLSIFFRMCPRGGTFMGYGWRGLCPLVSASVYACPWLSPTERDFHGVGAWGGSPPESDSRGGGLGREPLESDFRGGGLRTPNVRFSTYPLRMNPSPPMPLVATTPPAPHLLRGAPTTALVGKGCLCERPATSRARRREISRQRWPRPSLVDRGPACAAWAVRRRARPGPWAGLRRRACRWPVRRPACRVTCASACAAWAVGRPASACAAWAVGRPASACVPVARGPACVGVRAGRGQPHGPSPDTADTDPPRPFT